MDFCIPLAPGSRPKQSPQFKIDRLLQNTSERSTMAADFFHMVRRFLAGKAAANPAEEVLFNIFQHFSPKCHDIMACTLNAFDSLSPENRKHLFNSDFLGDINLPNNPLKLRRALLQEAFDHASTQVFGSNKCTNGEHPGLVRTQPFPGGELPPSQVLISRINGLRTGQFLPRLTAGEYTTEEVQQTCHMELDENNNPKQVCETQTTSCPSGTAFDGICLRLHPVKIGGNVVLEGMNFSSIDTKVQLTDMNGNVRQLDTTYVCGDEDTPLTEIVNEKEVPIIDSRVHDRLSFGVPDDMAPGQYNLQVILPNPNHVGGWPFDQLFSDSITVELDVPSITVQISSETLHCIDETGWDWLGSDEVGIKIASIPFFTDHHPGDVQEPNNGYTIEFPDVDSGQYHDMNYLLFSNQQQIDGVGIMIRGWEIDGTDEYRDAVAEFEKAIREALKTALIYYDDAQSECYVYGSTDPNNPEIGTQCNLPSDVSKGGLGDIIWGLGLLGGAIYITYKLIEGAIEVILKLIDFIRGVWGPADLIIDDTISLTALDLLHLTSTDIPLPPSQEYKVNDIKVKVTPIEKSNNLYREKREYISDDEGSKYEIVLRYNRLT